MPSCSLDEGEEEIVKRSMIGAMPRGRIRSVTYHRPTTTATIWMLRPGESDPSGRTLYHAQLLLAQQTPGLP